MAADLSNMEDLLETIVSNQVATKIYGTSRFLQASTQAALGTGGTDFLQLSQPTAGITGSLGGAKKVSEVDTDKLTLSPVEFAVVVPMHENMLTDKAAVAQIVAESAIGSIASAIDLAIRTGADADGVPVPQNFGTFAGLTPQTVNNAQDLYRILSNITKDGFEADYAVISRKLLWTFKSQINANGIPQLQVSGDDRSGILNGSIPYITYESQSAEGYIGAFKSGSRFGQTSPLKIKTLTEATIPYKGTDFNLALHNHVAFRVHGSFGFNFFDESTFAMITSDGLNGS